MDTAAAILLAIAIGAAAGWITLDAMADTDEQQQTTNHTEPR